MTFALRSQHQYATLPTLPTRGPLPPMVSIVIPIARTNLVTNPSIELATTGYTAVGGSIARSATKQYHGTYSLAVTPGGGAFDGAYYTTSLTAGTAYAYSCKLWGIAGIPYTVAIATTGGAHLVEVQFTGTGRWQWISGYYLETSSVSRRLYFRHNNSTSTGIFYVDGVQVEAITAGETVSTYIDGDQLGVLIGQQPPAYGWNGTPHASTSYRTALTRAGGSLVNLQDAYSFLLTGLIALGAATPNNVSIPYTVLDGARYLRTTKPPRTISLPGRFQSDDIFSLQQAQSDFRAAVDRDLIPLQQPLVLQVEPRDECGNVIGDFAQIQCIYAGGLEGNDSNYPAEDAAPTFTMYVPYLIGGSGGAALNVQQTVANANYILQRSSVGVWSALTTGLNQQVRLLAITTDGSLYVGGDFTLAGGVANTNRIARWNGSAWSALTTGTNDIVYALAPDAAGNLYVGGAFTLAGGVANTVCIAKWNGSAWSALGTGANNTVTAIGVHPITGDVYAGGLFTSIGGTAANRIAKWNGAAWSALGTGMNGTVSAITFDAAGNLYVGGSFTDGGGVAAADYVAKWNGAAWSALGTGMDNGVSALTFGPNGVLYAGGSFTTAGGVAATYIAQWNGAGWQPLGSGVNNAVKALRFANDGSLYAGGAFSTAGGITVLSGLARWNGSAWTLPDVVLPGTAIVYAIARSLDGTLTIGYDTSGNATTAANTTVTSTAPIATYPVLTVGPATAYTRISQLVNYTTGIGVWLNYTMATGETIVLNFNPQQPSYMSTFLGDISRKLLPGSNPALLTLTQGANLLSFYSADSAMPAFVSWQNRYNGVADLVN